MIPTVAEAQKALRALADPKRVPDLMRFFKTGPGQYAEGDQFIGIAVPDTRRLVKQFAGVPLQSVPVLIKSRIHEERLLGLLLLVRAYQRGDDELRPRIYEMYVRHFDWINNWDLVDVTAEHITGAHLWGRDRSPLYEWAKSSHLWTRRIAIMSTFHFIKQREYEETLRLAEMLLSDPHDLIHKASGWMLREVGKRDQKREEDFLRQHYRVMPRTMLRYAIEKFPEPLRQDYLKGDVEI
jgi:3-methyladenine DNA glycosylase AlkD